MEIQGYFTGRGLALSAKLSAGAALTITRVVAGAGTTADPVAATSLPQPRQTLAVNTPTQSGNTATIPVTLVATQAEASYILTELGVYAKDPDEGEILYKLYRLAQPVDIAAASRMVLRFYLEETVSQDLGVTVACSPAGLITETEFAPVREKLSASFAPTRTVELTGAELPGYIAALPRLLTEHLEIHVTGTVTEAIGLHGFYGSGGICIQAPTLGDCTVKNIVEVQNCSLRVVMRNLAFVDDGKAAATYYKAAILGINVRQLSIERSSFSGNGTGRAILLCNASMGWVEGSSIQGFDSAVCAWGYSILGASNLSASNNTYGVNIYNGGIVLLTGSTPITVGAPANTNYGGLIVQNGALV